MTDDLETQDALGSRESGVRVIQADQIDPHVAEGHRVWGRRLWPATVRPAWLSRCGVT